MFFGDGIATGPASSSSKPPIHPSRQLKRQHAMLIFSKSDDNTDDDMSEAETPSRRHIRASTPEPEARPMDTSKKNPSKRRAGIAFDDASDAEDQAIARSLAPTILCPVQGLSLHPQSQPHLPPMQQQIAAPLSSQAILAEPIH
ncbi:hypothetical protein CPB84DRAFT_1853492 [Gymnopilus junonius]|uniref:Uncharacterized protein n=1 Tax=Gymnopilus junonius TaxID=109634 RepID=A0A9P5NBG0_GYMJU|nr:hypothetical protein CPB84DRAFT_1853492 [Gymnopilus junonius]